jgi:2-oxoisovalerate dehydrogenase E1 component
VLSEEQQNNSFAESLAHRITYNCFMQLDAPVEVMGAMNLPAVPINLALEAAMLPTPEKVIQRIQSYLHIKKYSYKPDFRAI